MQAPKQLPISKKCFRFMFNFLIASFIIFFSLLLILFRLTAFPIFFFVTKLTLRSLLFLEESFLKKIVKSFIGKYTYVPPSYSAIKINGIPSYKYARQGKEVGLPERISTIYDIHIAKSREYTFELEVDCSKGTYIRSLVSDIGDKLGVGASVASLRRLSSGSFNVEDSNKFFSLIDNQSPIFFNPDDLFSTVEINKSLLDHLKQHSNHKKVNNEFLSNLSKKLGVKSNKDQHKLLTIDEYPVGLINNNFNETGDYIYSDIKLF